MVKLRFQFTLFLEYIIRFPNLGQGSHIIRVVMIRDAQFQISQNIGSDPLSQFAATSDEICVKVKFATVPDDS